MTQRADLSEAWGQWIAGLGRWDLFGGLTYDPKRCRSDGRGGFVRPGADVVRRHALKWLSDAPQTIGKPIEAAVIALEYQGNGWPHLHPLLRVAGGLEGREIRQLGGYWFARHGGNRLEVPREIGDVTAYASKYLSKDVSRGDVIFWPLRGSLSPWQGGLQQTVSRSQRKHITIRRTTPRA